MVAHLHIGIVSISAVVIMFLLLRILESFVLPRFRLAKGLMGQGQFGTSFFSSLYLSAAWEGGRLQNVFMLSLSLSSTLLGIHVLVGFWLQTYTWSEASLYLPICLAIALLAAAADFITREGRENVNARELVVSSAFVLLLITLLLRLDLRQPTSWIGHAFDVLAHVVGILLFVLHSGMFIQIQERLGFPTILSSVMEALRAFLLSSILLTKAITGEEIRLGLFLVLAVIVGVCLRTYEVLSYKLNSKDKEFVVVENTLPWLAAYLFLIMLGSAT